MLNLFKKSNRERLDKVSERESHKVAVVSMPRVVQEVKDGRILSKVEFTTDYVCSDDVFVNDYALENLLAAGVNLQEVGTLDQSRLSAAKHLDGMADKIRESINSKSIVEPKND